MPTAEARSPRIRLGSSRAPTRSGRVLLRLVALVTVIAWLTAHAIDPDPARLCRGEFLWHPEVSPNGPLVIVISLDEQRVYVYRNGIAIGVSTISSGKPGFRTPTGVYTILQKKEKHFSNLYDDAPMPYMERLTWDGVALHAGSTPGYPSSHGCVRLPLAFARRLFAVTRPGVAVIVADSRSAPAPLVHPAMLAPIGRDGSPLQNGPLRGWDDAAASDGPVSVLVSTRNRRVYVYRDGIRIASAPFSNRERVAVGGSVLYVMGGPTLGAPSRLDPARPRHRWTAFPIATRHARHPRVDAAAAINVSPTFARRLYAILRPGATVLVTDLPAYRSEPEPPSAVLEASGRRARP